MNSGGLKVYKNIWNKSKGLKVINPQTYQLVLASGVSLGGIKLGRENMIFSFL